MWIVDTSWVAARYALRTGIVVCVCLSFSCRWSSMGFAEAEPVSGGFSRFRSPHIRQKVTKASPEKAMFLQIIADAVSDAEKSRHLRTDTTETGQTSLK
jgi:hypothetical protein